MLSEYPSVPARALSAALQVALLLLRGGFARIGRHAVYAGCGAMLPGQPPLWPRWYREERTVVVRLGGSALVVSRL